MSDIEDPSPGRQRSSVLRRGRSGERVGLVALIALAALTYGWLSWSNRAPTIFSDEAGTLGNARWIAGGSLWPMGAASASNVSYPVLLAPIFSAVDSPEVIYRLAVMLNVVLVAAMVWVFYVLARRCLHATHAVSLTAAACGVGYPAVAVQVGVAWVEVTAMFGVAVLVLTAMLAVNRLTPAILVAHGGVAGFVFEVHSRFFAVPALAIIGLATVAVVRPRVRWWAIGSAALAGMITLGLRQLQSSVQQARWDFVAVPETGFKRLLSILPGPEVRSFAGQSWYLIAGTGGLIVLGFVVVVRVAARSGRPAARALVDSAGKDTIGVGGRWMALYLGLILASVFFISVTFLALGMSASPDTQRADFLYYGRYNECLVPTLICAAVAALLNRSWRRYAVWSLGAAAVCGPILLIVSFATKGYLPFNGSLNPYMLTALQPLFGLDSANMAHDAYFVVPAAFAGAGAALVLMGLTLIRRWLAPVVTIACFAILSISDVHRVSVTPELAKSQIPSYERLHELNPPTVAYDPKTVGVYAFYAMPFWLNRSRFTPFDSSAANWPAAGLFIGPPSWPQAATHGLKLFLVDKVSGKGFYVPAA